MQSCPQRQFYHYRLMFCVEEIQEVVSVYVCVLYCLQHLKRWGIETNAESELHIVFGSKTMVFSTNMHPQRALFWMVHGN